MEILKKWKNIILIIKSVSNERSDNEGNTR